MTTMDKNKKTYVLAALAVAVMLAGCVPAKVTPESAAPVVSVADAFAAEVAAMTTGTSAVMASPFGTESQVRVGEFYTSGLAQTCRQVSVSAGGDSHRVVICKDGDTWYTAAPIFEESSR